MINFKRLKIVEQIIIVVLFAVIIPMAISGFIINNINQQSMRSQLKESAVLISKVVSEEIDVFASAVQNELKQILIAESSLKTNKQKQEYFQKVVKNSPQFKSLQIVNSEKDFEILKEKNLAKNEYTISIPANNGKLLAATFDIDSVKEKLFKPVTEEERQIYVLSSKDENLLAAHNYKEIDYANSIKNLPKNLKTNTPVIYGSIKNQPLVYLKKTNPEITIIVNTTKNVTNKAINENRAKIVLAVVLTSLTVILVVGLYTYYLYINIRQLFKAIIAISKGNYQRKIRLISNVFTPYEVIFLAFEFNRMASQIHSSYLQLQKNNIQLKNLNEFRSNLIDTVSHELRTPLTSILGYTSRLLRQDIELSEEMKQKSLRTIKKQSERLSKIIEDLLVVPDIEGCRIRMNVEPVVLNQAIDSAITFVKVDNIELINNTPEDFPLIMADKDRFEQVLVNLFENAKKYAYENTPIVIDSKIEDGKAKIYIKNQSNTIPQDKLQKLFEKFTRIDDKTTRTTRGTGLGLFIVKGLVEGMQGNINLYSSNEEFCVELVFNPASTEEIIENV